MTDICVTANRQSFLRSHGKPAGALVNNPQKRTINWADYPDFEHVGGNVHGLLVNGNSRIISPCLNTIDDNG
jgi:hypothetical protein